MEFADVEGEAQGADGSVQCCEGPVGNVRHADDSRVVVDVDDGGVRKLLLNGANDGGVDNVKEGRAKWVALDDTAVYPEAEPTVLLYDGPSPVRAVTGVEVGEGWSVVADSPSDFGPRQVVEGIRDVSLEGNLDARQDEEGAGSVRRCLTATRDTVAEGMVVEARPDVVLNSREIERRASR